MTEILTESFCERCGTRYTFESAAPRKSRLGRVRTVSKGLRNFVLSDESTLSEAMADARSDEERSATTSQLDAFHRTFNFCLTCRQYTCGNCWNTAEGRCLTCMPLPGTEVADDLMAVPPIAFVEPTNGFHDHEHDHGDGLEAQPIGVEAWPEADLGVEQIDRALGVAAVADAADLDELPSAEEAAAGEAPDEPVDVAAEVDMAADAEAEAPVWAAGVDQVDELDEDAIVARISGVAPGQSVEDAVAAYEAKMAAEEAEREHQAELAAIAAAALMADEEPEVVAASGPEPGPAPLQDVDHDVLVAAAAVAAFTAPEAPVGPDGSAEPEPVAAQAEPPAQPQPAAEPQPAPPAQPEPVAAEADDDHHGLAAAAALAALATPDLPAPAPQPAPREDIVAQPTWPVAAVASPPPPPPAVAPVGEPPAVPAPAPGEPAQPSANPWLTVAPDEGAQPQWPAAPIWGKAATARRDGPVTLAGRALVPQDDAASMWAASAREVLSGAAQAPQQVVAESLTPQPCVSCGLSLSANARFCRRCGTRQG
jgi:ribosomal protein L40E